MWNEKTSIQNAPNFYEKTMELIRHVVVKLRRVSLYHDRYVGDSHKCILYCVKCKGTFGITDTNCKVLTEALFAIWFRLPETLLDPEKILTKDQLFHHRMSLSLPMHTMSQHLNEFGAEVTKKQTIHLH